MSEVEFARMSSKGQVVVPQDIREEIGVEEGSVFAVFGSGDSIILKKVASPSKKELLARLEETVSWGEKHAKQLGIREQNVQGIIHRGRGVKRA